MPLENDLDKVLIIGSGPTLIGSVAEMDLMATEAIDALTEEGIQVVLVILIQLQFQLIKNLV